MGDETEHRYLQILTEPIRVCALYRPKMGLGAAGLNLAAFQAPCVRIVVTPSDQGISDRGLA